MLNNYFQIELEVKDRSNSFIETWTCSCGGTSHAVFRRQSPRTNFEREFYACIKCGRIHSEKVFSDSNNSKKFMEFRIYDKKHKNLNKIKELFKKGLKDND